MPVFDPQTLSRTSSAAFFRLGEAAYAKQSHDAQSADAAVEATLDLYIADDRIASPRTVALDRSKRLFKRCMKHHGDLSVRSAIWFATVRCLEKRVPEFALARDLQWVRQMVDFDAAIEAPSPDGLAKLGLSPETFERYLRAPMLGFLHSADLCSVWALGLCQRFSGEEVQVLSRLSNHPALPAVTAMASELDAGFFEALLPSSSDEESEHSGDDGDSNGDAYSDVDVGATSADAGDTASAAPPKRQAQLEAILSALGLETVARAVLQAMVATPPAGRQDVSDNLAQSVDSLARVYVTYAARKHAAALAAEDLDGLAELVQHPMAARVLKNPTALMEEILERVGDLLAEGFQERSRKRLRDDATDCNQEGA